MMLDKDFVHYTGVGISHLTIHVSSIYSTIDLLNTRPAITQCTGSETEEEIYSQFGFPIVRIID